MKKITIAILLMLILATSLFVACDGGNPQENPPETITLNYISDGASVSEVEFSGTLNNPTVTKEGFSFDGWYLDEGFATPLTAEALAGKTGKVNVYAKWNKKVLTLNYVSDGASVREVEFSGTLNNPTVTKKGFSFDGWYLDEECTTPLTVEALAGKTGKVNVYAKWQPAVVINYYDGETFVRSETSYGEFSTPKLMKQFQTLEGWYLDTDFTQPLTVDNINGHEEVNAYAKWVEDVILVYNLDDGERYEKFEEEIPAYRPASRENYSFDGWFLDEEFTVALTVENLGDKTGLIPVYAKWSPEIMLTYMSCGSEVTTLKFEGEFAHPNAINLGYNLVGWYVDENCETELTVDYLADKLGKVYVYAKWEEFDIVLNYTSQGTSVGQVPFDLELSGAPVLDPVAGCEFGGWYLDEDFTTALTVENLAGRNGTVDVYAKWNNFVVTFNTMDGNEPFSVEIANGSVALPENPTSKYGTFIEWCLDKACTQPFVNGNLTKSITVYANWDAKSTLSIYCDPNYTGSEGRYNVKVGKNFDAYLAEPTRENYVFIGWYTDKALRNPYTATTFTKAGLSLYAGWALSPDHVHSWEVSETVAATCVTDGFIRYVCPVCESTKKETTDAAFGHEFDFSSNEGDFFRMVKCSNADCDVYVRQDSQRNYDDKFVFTFDEQIKMEIEEKYINLVNYIEFADRYDENNPDHAWVKDSDLYKENKDFEHNYYDVFTDYLTYVTEQYQYGYVYYCVYEGNPAYEADYELVSEFRTDIITYYYKLFRLIYETKYRNYFFSEEDGWTEEDIQVALTMSDSYGSDEYADLNKRADEILVEFRAMADPTKGSDILPLYEEFVDINNEIAQKAGYENYIEYAYENVYEREYSPEDVAQMREYVRTHLASVYTNIYNKYRNAASQTLTGESKLYGEALLSDSIFDSHLTTQIVADYFAEVNSNTVGLKPIDFYKDTNDLFRNGNYFTGKHDGAFSYWIPAQDATILFFGPDSYSGAFTFVHEFGHYYNNVYNPNLSMNMDHDETQSQGNEMLFLVWLNDYLQEKLGPSGANVFSQVSADNLFNMMAIVMLATAVDEFEYAVYTDYCDLDPKYQDGIVASEYDSLFYDIMDTYGIAGSLNSNYWRYVVIEAPCYYISYAMSAIPSMGIYAKGRTEGFDVARDSFLKLYTFSDNEEYVEVFENDDKSVIATYEEILNFCGLYGPFQEELYIMLEDYLG